jgi:RimJ/RimL family protein N-acetyltransferase
VVTLPTGPARARIADLLAVKQGAVATLFTAWMNAKRPFEAPTDPVLTPRLVLTPVGPDDIDDLVPLHGDPEVSYWTGPWTRAAVEAWAADMADRWTRDGVGKWMARDRSDGSLVGRGGFTRFDLEGETVLELGWAVRDARTGRGYATELGRAALAWASEHQPDLPVVAFTEVHNRASRAVMERLGMRPAGIIRREGLVEGRTGLHPDAAFALYRR